MGQIPASSHVNSSKDGGSSALFRCGVVRPRADINLHKNATSPHGGVLSSPRRVATAHAPERAAGVHASFAIPKYRLCAICRTPGVHPASISHAKLGLQAHRSPVMGWRYSEHERQHAKGPIRPLLPCAAHPCVKRQKELGVDRPASDRPASRSKPDRNQWLVVVTSRARIPPWPGTGLLGSISELRWTAPHPHLWG